MRSKSAIEIFTYWNDLRGTRKAPYRQEVEPAGIRGILPDLFILEMRPEADLRFRLAGTHVCALFGRELRGTTFDSLWRADETKRVNRVAAEVMTEATPIVLSATALSMTREPLQTELVLLPLASPDGEIDRIIGAIAPLSRPGWLHATAIAYLDLAGLRAIDIDKTEPFLQNRPEIVLPPPAPARPAPEPLFGGTIRRVLHLRVFEGGRQD
ncbi:PAS domain-containing protein [Ensifer soli]|uniref:PAS domain-containing protein n=1 Tax=Ciceribacter sp. sgz301302 TaxID=3342379 RepID=UPI0035B95F34